MKTLVFFICLCTLNAAYTQEPTNTYAKQAYATLNSALQKLSTMKPSSPNYQVEIDKAQRKLESIRENEPGFDLSEKEKELHTYIEQRKSAVAANARSGTEDQPVEDGPSVQVPADEREAALQDARVLETEMNALFKTPRIQEFEENGLLSPKAASILEDYARQAESFVQQQGAERIQKAKALHRYSEPDDLRYERQGFALRMSMLEEAIQTEHTPDIALLNYYTLRKYGMYWQSLHDVLPEDADFAHNLEIIQTVLARYPSTDAILQDVEARNKAFLAQTKMPDAVRRDAALEAQFSENFKGNGWNETILEIHLLDTDWHVYRDELNAAILGRYQSAAIAVKDANGNCLYYEYTISQDYTGAAYQQTVRRQGFNRYSLACENVH